MQNSTNSYSKIGDYGQIYTQQQWDQFYTRGEYQQKTTRVAGCTLHFLIAFNQPDSAIIAYIDKMQNVEKLFTKDTECSNLTPLHMAAMRANRAVCEAILNKCPKGKLKNCLEATDSYGWTPLQHAFLSSESLFQWFLSKGASPKAKNGAGGDIESLKKLTGRVILARSLDSVSFEKKGNPLTADQLKKLGFFYTDHPIYMPKGFELLWKHDSPSLSPVDLGYQEELRMRYQKFKENPPKMIVRECEELKGKSPNPYEVVAAVKVKAGNIAGEYTGIVYEELESKYSFAELIESSYDDTFLLNDLDAKEAGSAMRFANAGFPNCVGIPLFQEDGTTKSLLIALEDIEPNAPLLWSYGSGAAGLTYGRFVLLAHKEMREHFKRGLQAKIEEIKSLHSEVEKLKSVTFEICNKQKKLNTRLLYPLENPAALLDLHFNKLCSAEDWIKALDAPDFPLFKEWQNKYNPMFWTVHSLLLRLREVDQAFKKGSPQWEQIAEWVLQSIGNLTLMQILRGLKSAVQKKPDDCKTYLDSLPLKDYDWKKDADAPLGFDARKQDLLQYYRSLNLSPLEIMIQCLENMQQLKATGAGEKSESYRFSAWIVDTLRQGLKP